MFDINNIVKVNVNDAFELLANIVTIGSIIYKLIPFRYIDNPLSKTIATISLNRNPCPVARELKKHKKEEKEKEKCKDETE